MFAFSFLLLFDNLSFHFKQSHLLLLLKPEVGIGLPEELRVVLKLTTDFDILLQNLILRVTEPSVQG